jgi:hypothetical protein
MRASTHYAVTMKAGRDITTEANMSKRKLYEAAYQADSAWAELLKQKYGRDAGDARYDSRGQATPELRAAYIAKVAADRKAFGFRTGLNSRA